ncbi:MAG: FtsX-like permease family protein [Gemmatimonadetes bacterium]|nr:FtsX-like permease family protein [Gemmatimonadota bacterium]
MSSLRSLDRKMLRELWRLRGQLVSIGLVVASAVAMVVTMRGTYEALFAARADYYQQSRFADVWATVERAPESIASDLRDMAGVSSVSTRVSTYATLDLPWLDAPGMGLFLSIPDDGRPVLNDLHITSGRYLAPDRSQEVVVSEAFLTANDLVVGDTVRAVLNGRLQELIVVGGAISAEHSYSVPPGALYPDDERYGVFWISRSLLGPVSDLEDAFNDVALKLASGANPDAVIAELDRLLEPYGGTGAYVREDQLSFKILDDELESNRTMGTAMPVVFLGVAAFLMNLVLSRLIATQRNEIGTLKAFGYTDREVARHFLSYAVVAVGLGTVVGSLGGAWAGGAMVELYGDYFKFPVLEYELSWTLVAIAAGVSLVSAVAGSWSAVRKAVSLPPAEAMRPEPPARFSEGWMERSGLGDRLPNAARFVLRNMTRRPLRALMSSFGIAFSVAILVVGMFMFDGVELMMELQFSIVQREDLAVSFNQPVGREAELELARLDGVTRVEPYHAVPVRFRAGHRERELAITGLRSDSELRKVVSEDGLIHPIPLEGIVLSRLVAERLHLSTGDDVDVEMLVGERAEGVVQVAGIVDDLMGIGAYMELDALGRLTRQAPEISGAYLLVNEDDRARVNGELKRTPAVASVVSPDMALESFEEQLEESLLIGVFFLLGFAGVISVAVIYNGTRIALSERGRELASLRVLGFTRPEVARLLFGEQAILTLAAIPMGWALGYVLAAALAASFQSETYRIPTVVSSTTYLVAAVVTIASALASGMLVRRRLDHLDLISVLKTRE